MIEEELSSRRTISSLSEKQESSNQPNQSACTLPVSGIIGNDELNQQPEHFLKETPVTKFAENSETARYWRIELIYVSIIYLQTGTSELPRELSIDWGISKTERNSKIDSENSRGLDAREKNSVKGKVRII